MNRKAAAAVGIGAAIGLAWASSLRAWMTHLAIEFEEWPSYTWEGTFLSVLGPTVAVGALIGFDWHRRRESKGRVPLVVWSPLLLVVGPALMADNFIGTLMDTGEGGGAIGVVLIGMTGGFALSGQRRLWVRGLTGLLAFGITAVMVSTFYFQDQGVTPSGTFGGVYLVVLMVWLAVGCSVPMRRMTSADPGGVEPGERRKSTADQRS